MPKENFNQIKILLLKSKKVNEKYILPYKKNFDKERELLNSEWTRKNEEAKQTGVAIHETIHNMFITNLSEVKSSFGIADYLVYKTEEFLNTESGLFPEFKMVIKIDDEFEIVGIADLIVKNGNNISIIDWKSQDKITTSSIYEVGKRKKKTMKYPLCKLEDSDLVHYQLQLSLYAWMLQQMNSNFIINTLKIIQLKDMSVKKIFEVDYLLEEVNTLIKWYVKSTKLRLESEKCRDIKY